MGELPLKKHGNIPSWHLERKKTKARWTCSPDGRERVQRRKSNLAQTGKDPPVVSRRPDGKQQMETSRSTSHQEMYQKMK